MATPSLSWGLQLTGPDIQQLSHLCPPAPNKPTFFYSFQFFNRTNPQRLVPELILFEMLIDVNADDRKENIHLGVPMPILFGCEIPEAQNRKGTEGGLRPHPLYCRIWT